MINLRIKISSTTMKSITEVFVIKRNCVARFFSFLFTTETSKCDNLKLSYTKVTLSRWKISSAFFFVEEDSFISDQHEVVAFIIKRDAACGFTGFCDGYLFLTSVMYKTSTTCDEVIESWSGMCRFLLRFSRLC